MKIENYQLERVTFFCQLRQTVQKNEINHLKNRYNYNGFYFNPFGSGIITLGIYKLFELFVWERIIMNEKLGDKFNMGDISGKFSFNVNYSRSRFSFSALKSGCLMIDWVRFANCFFHLPALLSLITLPAERRHFACGTAGKLFYGACVLFFGGIGLISAFLIEIHIHKQKES